MISSCGSKYNWQEHYHNYSDDPYGTSVIYGLLDEYLPEQKLETIKDSLSVELKKEETKGSYFYIGPYLWFDSLRMNAMLEFVERGNDAFIIAPTISIELLDTISAEYCIDLTYEQDFIEEDYDTDYLFEDSLVNFNLVHDQFTTPTGYPFHYRYQGENQPYMWGYLPSDLFCGDENEMVWLGSINDTLVNFAKLQYGKGTFYLHTNPIAFTNYHIIQKEGRVYTEKVLSHLDKGPILWDNTKRSFEFPGRNRSFGRSPLQYILSQPALAWGWYLLVGMAVLYLIFRAKRRQRVIPVIEKNENTSLEFINTIGRLYFVQNNHRQLALEKMRLFLGFIRERYNIPTRETNEAFRKQLSNKSEIPLDHIEKIFTVYKNIAQTKFTSENTLATFHRQMELFYLKCK